MPLAAGARLGPYEIVEPIGRGGMGEVYRARDTTLDRDVAIKVLPDELASDAQRVARFEREAKLLASLNHPNIASIYGFESNALVLELVDGPTLAERVQQGPIPVDEAMAIARQIAEALEAGHDAGIIHRDLKPANIKLKDDGTVKVLDYGLAKALADDVGAPADAELSQSPTLTRQGTQVGMILGTAAYMSPEQAKGKRVDKRTDVFAFGTVLYEMLTGKRAFAGEDVSEILAAVLKLEPDWDALPANTGAEVGRVLRRCLQKDPARRLRDVGDARIELDEARLHESDDASSAFEPAFWQKPQWMIVIAALLAAAAWFAGRSRSGAVSRDRPVTRYAVTLPGTDLLKMNKGGVAVAQDGQKLAFVASRNGVRRLYLRDRDQVTSVPLSGTEGAENPFFSPDGRWLAFFDGRSLMKVSLSGGAPQLVADVKTVSANFTSRGGAWSIHGTIVLGSQYGAVSLPADGGAVKKLPSKGRRFPFFLPGGESVLLDRDGQVSVHNLVSGEDRVLLDGSQPRVVYDYLVVARDRSLWAAPFDVERAEVTGPALPVVDGVTLAGDGRSYDLSTDGVLAFVPSAPAASLSVVDPSGGRTELAPIEDYHSLRLSPDGRRVAGDHNDRELWVYAVDSGTRLTVGTGGIPVWSPDGASVVYAAGDAGTETGRGVAIKASDGTGDERMFLSGSQFNPSSWSSDGAWIALDENDRQVDSSFDIWISSPSGEAKPFLATPANEYGAMFSPDGRWIAYQSDETGRFEVYVMPFRGSGERVAVSVGGGTSPIWSANELYFRRDSAVMSVSVEDGEEFSFSAPRLVADGPYRLDGTNHVTFGVFPDGKLLVVDTGQANEIHVVLNWHEELKRLVPTNE